MFNFKRSHLVSMLFISLFFISKAQASVADPCESIKGNWYGTWTLEKKFVLCKWHADASVYSLNNGQIEVQMSLSNTNHRHLCKDNKVIMTGNCYNGLLKLSGNGNVIEGDISGNLVSLVGVVDRLNGFFQYGTLTKN